MFWKCVIVMLVVILIGPSTLRCRNLIHIIHAHANTNAQSLIRLPMGDHKTIIDMGGNLHWSQWSLKRRGMDVPFGFSAKIVGVLDIQLLEAGMLDRDSRGLDSGAKYPSALLTPGPARWF